MYTPSVFCGCRCDDLFDVVVLSTYNNLRLQLDEIGRRFTGVGGSLQLLSREVAVMTKKLEQLLQQ
jgi:hypothetical protein